MSDDPFGPLVDELSAAVERRADSAWPCLARASAAVEVAVADAGARSAGQLHDRIAALGRHFGLATGDVQLLTLALAAELDPTLHLLLGLLSGDDGPARPTVALALELIGEHPTDTETTGAGGALRLTAAAPLRTRGLLELPGDGALPGRRLRVPDRVVEHLLGDETPPMDLRPLLREPIGIPVDGTAALCDALRAGHDLVWVHSPAGGSGAAMATAACTELDVPVTVADLARSPDIGRDAAASERVGRTVRRLLLEAGLAGSVLVLDGAEHAEPAADLLTDPPVPVIAVAGRPWRHYSGPLPIAMTAPPLGSAQRAELWWPLLGGVAPPPDVAALRLDPDQIVRAARHARSLAALAADPAVSADQVRRSCRELGRHRRSTLTGPVGMDDLVLPDHARQEMQRLLGWARHRDEIAGHGLLHGSKGTGVCALFSGSPGTGKTLAAHVLADALGTDLLPVELSTVVDKYIGETEKNLEQVFTEAESLGAVLFFDEADALFGSRSEVRDAKDRYANQEIAYLLQRMEQFDGVTVLATNLRGNLDPAFSRRLQFIIHFPDPDAPTRRRLWSRHLAELDRLDPDDVPDVDELADTLDLAGGDIRNIVLAAAHAALADGAAVGMVHLRAAAAREFTKLGRRLPDARRG